MDASTSVAEMNPRLGKVAEWLRRERDSGRFYRYAAIGTAAILAAMIAFSVSVLSKSGQPGSLLSPPLIALLLVANLIPAIALMVFFSRRVAKARAARGGLGSGRLHTRLVALFSVIAAVPTVMVAIFASLLFQSGLDFWLSERARECWRITFALARAALTTRRSSEFPMKP